MKTMSDAFAFTGQRKKFDAVVRGLAILEPYIDQFSIDPVPASFDNGAPAHSHSASINIILAGVDEPTESEQAELVKLGWSIDWPYYTL
jgi:hypothetical protein